MPESSINCAEGRQGLIFRRAAIFRRKCLLVSLPTLGRFCRVALRSRGLLGVRLGSRARIWALAAALQPCNTNRCSLDAVEAASHCSTPSQGAKARSAATNAPQR